MIQRFINRTLLLLLLAGCGGGGRPTIEPPAEDSPAQSMRFPLPEMLGRRELSAAAFAPDGKILAACTAEGIQLIDLTSGQVAGKVDAYADFILFSPDGKRLATTNVIHQMGPDHLIINSWDVTADWKPRKRHTFKTEPWGDGWDGVCSVWFSPTGQELAAGSLDGMVRVWDLETGKERLQFPGGVAAQFAPDGKSLIAVNYAGVVRRWDAKTGKRLPAPDQNSDFVCVHTVVFSTDGKHAAISDSYRTCVKDTATGLTVRRIDAFPGAVPLAFLDGGKTLALAEEKGVRLVDVGTGNDLGWLPNPSGGGWAFSADGKQLARKEDKSLVVEETVAALARKEPRPTPSDTDPPGVPLAVELVGLRDTYVIEGNANVGWPLPDVELEFRLRNTGKQAIAIEWIDLPDLYLFGDGAFNWPVGPISTGVDSRALQGGFERKAWIIGPGQYQVLPIGNLGRHSLDNLPRWLLPGDYTLRARFRGSILPAPPAAETDSEGFGRVTIRSAPLQLKVLAAKDSPAPATDDPLGILHSRPLQPDDGGDEIRAVLRARPVNLDKGIEAGTPLKHALEFLSQRYDLTFRINEPAFKKVDKERIEEARIELPPLVGASIEAVLHFLLEQIDATIEIDKRIIVIVPAAKPQDLAERLRPARPEFRDYFKEEVTVEQGIETDTPLAKALELLGDRYDFTFYIDRKAFERAGIKEIDKRSVSLGRIGRVRRDAALQELLKPAGAAFVIRDHGLVLVVPGEKLPMLSADLWRRDQPAVKRIVAWNGRIVAEADRFYALDLEKASASPIAIPPVKTVIGLASRGPGQALALGRNDQGLVLLAQDGPGWKAVPLPDEVRQSAEDFHLCADKNSIVLAKPARCYRHAGNVWKAVPVKDRPERTPPLLSPSQHILYGNTLFEAYDQGEFGGELLALDLLSGDWARSPPPDKDYWGPVTDCRLGPDQMLWLTEGMLHLANRQGALYRFDGKKWKAFASTSNSGQHKTINWNLVPTQIGAMAFDPQGLPHALTYHHGVVRFDWREWKPLTAGWPSAGHPASALHVTAEGLLVIGAGDAGILLWDPASGKVRRLSFN